MISKNIHLPWTKYLIEATQALYTSKIDLNIHIITKNLFVFDATSRCVIEQVNVLEALGANVKLYAERSAPEHQPYIISKETIPCLKLSDTDVILFHYSIEDKFLDLILRLNCKKVLYYHGITPPEFLTEGSEVRNECERGKKRLKDLESFDIFIANSNFNLNELFSGFVSKRLELGKIGFMIPPILSLKKWDNIEEEIITALQETISPCFLYIGRKFPHKNIEGLIKFFCLYYSKYKAGQLIIAGHGFMPEYQSRLKEFVSTFSNEIQDRIHFLNQVTEGQLKYLYKKCDFLLTFSRHEGFCVPIAEAYKFNKPVITHDTSALKETAGKPGIVVKVDDFESATQITQETTLRATYKILVEEILKYYKEELDDEVLLKNFISIFLR